MLQDSGGQWTEAVEADYTAWRQRLGLFRGAHRTYFVAAGERVLARYVTFNWLGERLTKRLAELVFPGFPRIYATRKSDQAVVNELILQLRLPLIVYPTALMASWAGSATWKVYWSRAAGGPRVRLWGINPGEYAVWDYRPGDYGSPYAVNCWYGTEIPDGDRVRQYRVNERYQRVERRVVYTNQAWRTDEREVREVGLAEAFPPGVVVPPAAGAWVSEELPCMAIPNVDLFGDGTGDTDYTESLIEVQRQVNLVAAQRALVIALTGVPQFRIPQRLMRADGTVDLSQIWLEIEYEGDEGTPIRIDGWTGNLENTKEQLELLNSQFIMMTPLSRAVDGEQVGSQAESGYARRLGFVKTESGVFRRRNYYDPAFEWAVREGQRVREAFGGARRRPVGQVSTLWPPPIPVDAESAARSVDAARRNGVMSIEVAVRRLNPDETNEWVQGEVDRIRQEREAGLASPEEPQRVVRTDA